MIHSIGILVFPGLQQLDLTGPYEVFAMLPGAEVHLVWRDRSPVIASSGLAFTPTATFEDCPRLDVLCVPGGGGVNALMEDRVVLEFLRARAVQASHVTSVCTGALLLGAAGLLAGRRATTHWSAHDLLAMFGATPVHDRVVRDGTLITAGGVTAGIDFGLTVAEELAGRAEAEAIQLALEYAPAPPFDAGTPDTAPAECLATVQQRGLASRMAREVIVARITKASST